MTHLFCDPSYIYIFFVTSQKFQEILIQKKVPSNSRIIIIQMVEDHLRFPLEGRVMAVTKPKSPTFMEPSNEKKMLAG